MREEQDQALLKTVRTRGDTGLLREHVRPSDEEIKELGRSKGDVRDVSNRE